MPKLPAVPQLPIALDGDGYLTVAEAAEILTISKATLYELVNDSLIEYVNINKSCIRITRAGLREYLARNTIPAKPSPPTQSRAKARPGSR